MHAQGDPKTMQDAPAYDDVLLDVADCLEARVAAAEAAGIPRARILVDPGIGFGKTVAHNLALVRGPRDPARARLRDPVRRLAQALHRHDRRRARTRPTRLPGSIAVALEALRQGAQVIRVHDVKETRQAVALWAALNGDDGGVGGMARKLFGTDGVRGRANDAPMTAETALRLGQAAGRYFTNGGHAHRVLIGKDTRRSGYMLETALTAGFTSVGMDVFLVGPVPTPAVGMLARSMRADLGVMISASHNPFQDNGIKFFGPDGFKLSDAAEEAIEALLEAEPALAEPARIGRATRIDDGRGRYMEFAKTTFPRGQRLDGLKVVVDCANGAAYRTAPEVLWELGAEVVPIGVEPGRLQHQRGLRLDPPRGGGRRRCARTAPTSASASTATPTG